MNLLNKLIPEKTVYRIFLLCVLTLAIYYPAIFAEISLIDDLDMVNALLNNETMKFRDIFVPRSAGGGYYRPLLGLSQYIDREFWMMDSTFMHLENILFHLLNSILVYLLTLRLTLQMPFKKETQLPLTAALLFAFHPIATESVNWISGRTDIMACNFILVSTIFLIRFRDDGKKYNLVISGVALLLSLFAKEVAFGYILALPILLRFRRTGEPLISDPVVLSTRKAAHPFILFILFYSASVIVALYTGSYWTILILGCCYVLYSLWPGIAKKSLRVAVKEHLTATSVLVLTVLVTSVLFYILRKIAFTSNIDRISNTLRLIFQDTNYAISIFLGAAGFYVKKFFLPLPLNFFILEINPLYDLIGIAVFLVILWLMLRQNTLSAISIAGMCCVLPAFPFAFGTIAWTGYAERYIYAASAFWSIAVTLLAAQFFTEQYVRNYVGTLFNAGLITVLLSMAIITHNRNITWKSNMALISDTVTQNPRQKELRGLYMLAFIRSGDLKSAREQYRIASSLHSIKYLENFDLNMAGIEATEGNKAAAEVLLQKVLSEKRAKSDIALKFYTKFLENELSQTSDPGGITSVQNKIIPLYKKLYELNRDPFILYRLGQIYVARNENQAAINSFEQAVKAYPSGTMYGDNSAKIVQKLKEKMQP